MQVYRGLPILTNQSPAHAARRRSGRSTRRPRSARTRRSPTRRSTRSWRRERRRSSSAARASISGRRSRSSSCRRRPSRARASAGRRLYDEDAERGPRAPRPSSTRLPPSPSTRTTAAASCARSSSPRPGASLAPDADRLWAEATRHPTVDRRARRAEGDPRAPDRGANARDVRGRRRGGGATRARRAGSRRPRARRSASTRSRTLPREEAIDAIVVRTRRYAAYQRKWMRRVPGLVMVDADRPPGEIADDIVALARPRERLPRR